MGLLFLRALRDIRSLRRWPESDAALILCYEHDRRFGPKTRGTSLLLDGGHELAYSSTCVLMNNDLLTFAKRLCR